MSENIYVQNFTLEQWGWILQLLEGDLRSRIQVKNYDPNEDRRRFEQDRMCTQLKELINTYLPKEEEEAAIKQETTVIDKLGF